MKPNFSSQMSPEDVVMATTDVTGYDKNSYQEELAFSLHVHTITSSNENIFRVTDPLCGEFTGHRWIPCTKASDAELWCFLWSASEWTVE